MRKFLISVNGNRYEVEVEEVNSQVAAAAPAKSETAVPVKTAVPAEVPVAATKPAVAVAGAHTITAPMPGIILKVNVNQGDTVGKGQVLVILEAMKMENEIVAPSDGKVVAVNVAKGNSVNAGDILVQLG